MTINSLCRGVCTGKTEKEIRSLIFNPDCPQCMEVWCKFLEKNNLYGVTDKQ